jgi:hypothetical protein
MAVTILALSLCLSTPIALAHGKHLKSDWDTYFGAGVVPPYPLSGRLIVSMSKDQHYSYTNSDGQTSSFHCSSDSTGTECQDGGGLYYYLVMPDDSSIYVSPGREYDGDLPLGRTLAFSNALLDIPTTERNNRVFHFRWVDSPIAGRVLCVQVPGAESIPNGKELKEYVKRHRMETCYFANESKWHPKAE